MSLALRVDDVRANQGGTVEVFYTFGTAPLPVTPAGSGVSFLSRLDVVAQKNNLLNNFSDQTLLMMGIAIYSIVATDPNLTGATALIGKTITLDPTKSNGALVYG